MSPRNTVWSSVTKYKWTQALIMLVYTSVSVSSNPFFERLSMFQRSRNHLLKGATIKGKNMLPIGAYSFL